MSLDLVVYVPGIGGNHLKNLLCLSASYSNSSDLRPEVYENPDPKRPPGEVWCVGGRNLQDVFFDRMQQEPNHSWVLPAHFGEMCEYAPKLDAIPNKKMIVISMEDQASRRKLDQRQQRLGQCIHPYWLDEELIHVYRPEVLSKIFQHDPSQYMSLNIKDFWHKDFVSSDVFAQLKQFLNIELSNDTAQRYHHLWINANNL